MLEKYFCSLSDTPVPVMQLSDEHAFSSHLVSALAKLRASLDE